MVHQRPRLSFWRLYYPLFEGARVIHRDDESPLSARRLYLTPPHSELHFTTRRKFTKWYFHFTVEGLDYQPAPGL